MAIDSRIPLQAQQFDAPAALIGGEQFKAARAQNELAGLTIDEFKENKPTRDAESLTQKEEADLKAGVFVTERLKQFVDRGDLQGAMADLISRRDTLKARGTDTTNTENTIAQVQRALESGDLSELNKTFEITREVQRRFPSLFGTPSLPSDVRSFQEFEKLGDPNNPNQLTPAQQRFLQSKRGTTQIVDVGNVPTVVDRETKSQTPLSTIEQEAQGAATVAGAEAAAKKTGAGLAERTLALPQAKARLASTESKMDRLISATDEILDDADLWQAVGLGQGISIIPSTGGARVRARIRNLQSQAGLAVLQDMRDNSKTGGAVGQVSNFEQQLFQNNLAPLGELNVSPEDYRNALLEVRDYAVGAKQRFQDAFATTYPELNEPATGTKNKSSDAPTATGPNGEKLILQNGKWVPFDG